VLLTLGACNDTDNLTAPQATAELAPAGNRLATIEWEGSTPTLCIQSPDGSNRVRVHFEHVSNHVIGNYSPRLLPVTDETIRRFTRMKWSPDGRFLAVIVAPANEALQVVLVSADARELRTVSPNSQYLWGDVEWSPDSRRIAYIMATGPFGQAPDLFVTELGRDLVKRMTTGADLSGYDAVRFDATGKKLLFTQHLGFADDGINVLSRLASVDLESGAIVTGDQVVGEPQGLSRDGAWGLFIRSSAATPGVRELVRRLADGSGETVLTTGDLAGASIIEGDREAVVSFWNKDSTQSFVVLGLDKADDVHGVLPTVPTATWATLSRALQ
jgi:Tol biopolymer transport system component